MAKVTIQDALDYCLENPEGLSAEELLGKFPDYREELAPMLGLAARVMELDAPTVPATRRASMKARLVAQAGYGQRTTNDERPTSSKPVVAGHHSSAVRRRRSLWPTWVVGAAAALLLVFIWWSAANALPDNPFYGIKLASESVRVDLQSSNLDKTRAHIGLANMRLYDLRAMQEQGRLAHAAAAFDSYAANLDSSEQLWRDLPVQSHIDLAGLLYTSSEAGRVTFAGFEKDVDGLPVPLQERLRLTESALLSLHDEAARTLSSAHIDPASVLGSADANISPLLTPVVPNVVAVPTYISGSPQPVTDESPTVVAIGVSTATPMNETSSATPPGPSSTPLLEATPTHTSRPPAPTITMPVRQASATVRAKVTPTVKGVITTPTHVAVASTTAAAATLTSTPTSTATIFAHTSTATMIPTPWSTPSLPPLDELTPTPTDTVVVSPEPTEPPSGTDPTYTPIPPVPPPVASPTLPPSRPTYTPKPEPGVTVQPIDTPKPESSATYPVALRSNIPVPRSARSSIVLYALRPTAGCLARLM